MYGFKPQHARGKPVQNFADGGIVHAIKGALGMRPKTPEELRAADAKSQARNQEAAAAVAERNRKAQPAPQQQNAVSGYAGMSAMQRREKELGLKDGGRVEPRGFKPGGLIRGPGTGTSDSIETEKEPGTFIMPADSTEAIGPDALEDMGETVPVRLSNGEFEVPPEQVQALGEAVLTVMRNATHQPASGEQKAPTSNGFVPRQSFAGGGVVADEEKQRLANQTSMYVQGAQAAAASRPAAPPAAPASATPAQSQAKPAAAGFMPGTRAVFNESGKAIGDLVGQGRYGAAAGETARAALSYVPAVADDVIGGALRAVGPGVMDAGRQFFGWSQPGTAAPPASPAAPVDQTLTDQRMAAGTQSTPMSATPAAQTLAEAAASTPSPTQTSPAIPATDNQMAPGVFRHGRGQYSDNAGGMGFAPGFTGQPTAQNDAAWQRLADRSQADSMARVSAQQPAGFTPTGMQAPTVRHSGNDWQSRNELRNAKVSATSIMNDGGKWDKHGKGVVSPERAYAMGLAQTDATLRGAQPGVDVAAMRENAGIQRESMQQFGATTRTGMQEQGANARAAGRNAIERDEFGLKKEAAGFQTRAAKRLEDLQASYQSAKTPEERTAIAQQLRELQGKDAPARFKVASGGQHIDANGVPYRTPDRIFNEQTGVFSDGAGAAPAPQALPPKDQLKAGQTYSTPRGPARWDGSQFTPV